MSENSIKAGSAFGFAFRRLVAVLWGGLVAVLLYIGVILLGPIIDGRFFPVIKDYKISDLREEAGGGISFVTTFRKVRDCTYYGVSWFAPDTEGNMTRIQAAPVDRDPTAPQTGPMGRRVGQRQKLYPPAGSTEILAVMQHDCGIIWQTRTQIGPFKIRLQNGAMLYHPSPSPASLAAPSPTS